MKRRAVTRERGIVKAAKGKRNKRTAPRRQTEKLTGCNNSELTTFCGAVRLPLAATSKPILLIN
jgi:hypothetical protein